ncbi:TPR repeat-containing protein [Parafrankia sp. EAN1pec]|uniref:tetratricopeptide repeat protein n=1 Tax=Parafrankia sp. (strain EAN1pec) TaxID=298653 RepID=UPI0000541577|nr:TPR repeat-containing protein [Frankia sp. EAN1pec]
MCVSQGSSRLAGYMADLLDCNRLVAGGDRRAETYLRRGIAFWMVRDHHRAIADLSAAIEADPRLPDDRLAYAHYRRSVCRHQVFDLAGAEADASAAMALDPVSYVYTARAIARYFDGDPHGTLADAESALLRDPNDWEARAFRARARLELGLLAEAVEDFGWVIADGRCEKYASELHLQRAEALLELGRPEAAAADCTTAIDVSAHEQSHWPFIVRSRALSAHGPYLLRARAWLATGDLPTALADCFHAATIVPEDPAVYELRAQVYQAAGLLDEAIHDLARAAHLHAAYRDSDLLPAAA